MVLLKLLILKYQNLMKSIVYKYIISIFYYFYLPLCVNSSG